MAEAARRLEFFEGLAFVPKTAPKRVKSRKQEERGSCCKRSGGTSSLKGERLNAEYRKGSIECGNYVEN